MRCSWYLLCIRAGDDAVLPLVRQFLREQGRMKVGRTGRRRPPQGGRARGRRRRALAGASAPSLSPAPPRPVLPSAAMHALVRWCAGPSPPLYPLLPQFLRPLYKALHRSKSEAARRLAGETFRDK